MTKRWIYIGSTPVEFPPNITVESGMALPEYATEEKIASLLAEGLLIEESVSESEPEIVKSVAPKK